MLCGGLGTRMTSSKSRNGGAGEPAPELGTADSLGYRRPLAGFSTNGTDSSAKRRWDERNSSPAGLTGAMDRNLAEGEVRRLPDLGIALKSIFAFWLLYFSLITLRSLIIGYPDF